MICPHCNNNLEYRRQICPHCGKKVQIIINPPLPAILSVPQISGIIFLCFLVYSNRFILTLFIEFDYFLIFISSFFMVFLTIKIIDILAKKSKSSSISQFFPQYLELYLFLGLIIWIVEIILFLLRELSFDRNVITSESLISLFLIIPIAIYSGIILGLILVMRSIKFKEI